jgi:hypothetical protein
MSEQQEQLTQARMLLSHMTPPALAANRDELFFRAGEASARGQLVGRERWRMFWPAIAASLAVVAAGLGFELIRRKPEIVVERPVEQHESNAEAAGGLAQTPSQTIHPHDAPFNPRKTIVASHLPAPFDDLIYPQDRAALSEAITQQLRIARQQSLAAQTAAMDMVSDDALRDGAAHEAPHSRARTYLEIRKTLSPL